MLKFRLSNSVPPGALNISLVTSPTLDVSRAVGMVDRSHNIPENIASHFNREIQVHANSGIIGTDDIVLSSRSVVNKDKGEPNHLYYSYRIGRGLLDVLDKDASPTDFSLAAKQIRSNIKLLNEQDLETLGPPWDISVVSSNGNGRFTVDIYLRSRGVDGSGLKVKYNAYEISTSTELPNHIEVINASPYLSKNSDYFIQDLDTHYSVTGVIPSAVAPCIFLWNEGSGQPLSVDSEFFDFTGGNKVKYINKNPVETAAAINDLGLSTRAIPLSKSSICTIGSSQFGAYTVDPTGVLLKHDNLVHVLHNEETRISLLRPWDDPTENEWFARINTGKFTKSIADPSGTPVTHRYSIPEYSSQTFSPTYGSPYKNVADEEPISYSPDMIQTLRSPLRSIDDVVIEVDGDVIPNSTIIKDYDLLNGFLYLKQKIEPDSNVRISYVYEDTHYVYNKINLNPTSKHNPDILNKFVGFYIIPSQRGTDLFTRTVYHIVRDTISEIDSEISSLKFSDGTDVNAQILGIIQVSQPHDSSDVKIIDARSFDQIDADEDIDELFDLNPEIKFFWDISNWGGEPFQGDASITVQIPETIVSDSPSGQFYLDHDLLESDPSGFMPPIGILTDEEVEKLVKKHVAAGILPIIEKVP